MSSSIHLLPFNTKFRGVTNVSEHFQPEPLKLANNNNNDAEDSSSKTQQQLDHIINKAATALPYEKDLYVAAPKQHEQQNEENDNTNTIDNNENDNHVDDQESEQEKRKARVENASVLVAHFRGRKLVGRRVRLAENNNNSEMKEEEEYIGVVALVPLQEEDEEEELKKQHEEEQQQQQKTQQPQEPELSTTSGAAFVPGWKKKPTTAVRRSRPEPEEENENNDQPKPENSANQQQHQQEGRSTEPHVLDVSSSANEAQKEGFEKNKIQQQQQQQLKNGRIPSARNVVPLEKFSSFVVWDHDRLSTSTVSPAVGTTLWMNVAEALHGY